MQIVVENNNFAKKGSISFAEVLKLVQQRIMNQQNEGFFTLQNALNAQGSIQEDSKKTTPPVLQNDVKPSNSVTVEDISKQADALILKTITDQGSKEYLDKTAAKARNDPVQNEANRTVQLSKDNVSTVQNRSNQMGTVSSIKPPSDDHNASEQKKDSENVDSARLSDPESSRNERIEFALQLKRDLVHNAKILKPADVQKQTSQFSSNDTSNMQRTTVNQSSAEAFQFAQTGSASQKKETSDRNVQNFTIRETHHAVDLLQVRKSVLAENDTPIRQQNLTLIQTQAEDTKVQANSFNIPMHVNSPNEQAISKLFTQSLSSRQENLTTVFSENRLKVKNHPIELKGEKETEQNQLLKKASIQNIPKTSDTKPESESIEAEMIKPAGHRIVLFAQQVQIESNGVKSDSSTKTGPSLVQSKTQPVAVLSATQVRLIVDNLSRYVEKVSSEPTQLRHVKRELPETIKVTEPIKIETFKLTIAKEIKQIDQEPLQVKTERIESAEQLKEALNSKLAKKAYEHEQPAIQHIKVEEKSIDQVVLRVEREQGSDNLQTIVETIKQLRDTFTEKAEIQLSPPSLGKLEIELVKQQDRLTILMKVSTPEARELIENSSKELISRLSSLGFKVEQIEVRMNPRFEQEQTGEEKEQNQQFEDQQQRQQRHREGDEDDKSD
ncbi:hypothetical protein AS159_05965 [Thermotoga sp. Ku-13t]|uniref:flagellar hook-length control protein FliK n=1 Tax=Thermotoga sp. Ku-13t TaxID=1755813 RepID=UPI0013EC248E|nr:flagellar hook-length control protein FliK [Thermotoga sp. Ku-13t]KAF2957939.1 hypothetical protein AS159_05965 [Thermotoga sp. Ku-13t]